MRKYPKIMGLLGVAWMLWSPLAFAATITLQWDANTESDLAGYRLYQSSSSLISKTPDQAKADTAVVKTDINNPAATTRDVTGLNPETFYFFRLTAFNHSSLESGFNVDASGQPAEVMVFLPAANEAKSAAKILTPFNQDGINDQVIFGQDAEEVMILDFAGRKMFGGKRSDSANGAIVWNCKDTNGKFVKSGTYIAKIKKSSGSNAYQAFVVAK